MTLSSYALTHAKDCAPPGSVGYEEHNAKVIQQAMNDTATRIAKDFQSKLSVREQKDIGHALQSAIEQALAQ